MKEECRIKSLRAMISEKVIDDIYLRSRSGGSLRGIAIGVGLDVCIPVCLSAAFSRYLLVRFSSTFEHQ